MGVAKAGDAKTSGKSKAIHKTVRLTHKRDIELWSRLCARDEYKAENQSELIRNALRALDESHSVTEKLEGYEKRMSASLKALYKRFDQLESAQQINMAFLEVLMRTYYYHTVPVPKEAMPQAIADATRRIDKFIEDVAGMLQKGGAMQELTLRIMDTDAGMDNGE